MPSQAAPRGLRMGGGDMRGGSRRARLTNFPRCPSLQRPVCAATRQLRPGVASRQASREISRARRHRPSAVVPENRAVPGFASVLRRRLLQAPALRRPHRRRPHVSGACREFAVFVDQLLPTCCRPAPPASSFPNHPARETTRFALTIGKAGLPSSGMARALGRRSAPRRFRRPRPDARLAPR